MVLRGRSSATGHTIVEQAPRLLGVTPTPLIEALRQSFAWYQAQPRRLVSYALEDRLIARGGLSPSSA